jgi:glycosyltransferase involved in cell wall biosynthesis
MNIIHVVEPFASGIATFVKSLVENLQDDLHIIIHGERESVMRSAEVKQYFPAANTRFIRWPSAQRSLSVRKDTAAFWELYTILKQLKQQDHIDAVHLHSSKSGFLGRLACRLARISKVVYTPNGAPFLAGDSKFMKYIYGQLEKFGSFFGGKTVCCSTSEWEAYHAMGIEAACINNGVLLEYPAAEPVTTTTAVKPARFRIVTSGRIVDQKDPASFNAIAQYFEEFRDFEFVWVGDGEQRHRLTASNISVTGWLSPAETNEYIAGADIYLSTSHFEGMPFAVLEALALRKPVLLSDCVGNRDLVYRGLNGDVFHDGQEGILKILRYYNNRDMLSVMGEYSRQVCAQQFDVHTTFSSYRELYKS